MTMNVMLQSADVSPKLATSGFQPLTHLRDDLFGRNAITRRLELRPRRFRAGRKLGLHAPVVHRLAHGGFQEVGQRFAFAQHGFEVGYPLGSTRTRGRMAVFIRGMCWGCVASSSCRTGRQRPEQFILLGNPLASVSFRRGWGVVSAKQERHCDVRFPPPGRQRWRLMPVPSHQRRANSRQS
jgi:hypothetical protein